MKFQPGADIVVGSLSYNVDAFLGHGAVADVYRCFAARADGGRAAVVLKCVRDDQADNALYLHALRAEALVLAALNRAEVPNWPLAGAAERLALALATRANRRVIALVDAADLAGQPVLIQEFAPPAFAPFPVRGLPDERRVIALASAVAEAVVTAHANAFALKDFSPLAKGDRVRAVWGDDGALHELKLIDWNITAGAALRDPAADPDERERDEQTLADEQLRDLFMLGGHLYRWLLGEAVPLDEQNRPPSTLAHAANWKALSVGSQQILQRALHRDPSRRYRSADDLRADLAWWDAMLAFPSGDDLASRLEAAYWEATRHERFDRALALATLGEQSELVGGEAFANLRRRASDEVNKADELYFANARVALNRGNYRGAISAFQAILDQQPAPAAQRRARFFNALAQVGAQLKADAHEPEQANELLPFVRQMVDELNSDQWHAAAATFSRIEQRFPDATRDIRALGELGLRAAALREFYDELLPALRAAQLPADARAARWLEDEARRVQQLGELVSRLAELRDRIPDEADVAEMYEQQQFALQNRRTVLEYARAAAEALDTAEVLVQQAQAADTLQKIFADASRAREALAIATRAHSSLRDANPSSPIAQQLEERLEAIAAPANAIHASAAQSLALLGQAGRALNAGQFDAALDLGAQLQARAVGGSPIDGAQFLERVEGQMLVAARQAIAAQEYVRAVELVRQAELYFGKGRWQDVSEKAMYGLLDQAERHVAEGSFPQAREALALARPQATPDVLSLVNGLLERVAEGERRYNAAFAAMRQAGAEIAARNFAAAQRDLDNAAREEEQLRAPALATQITGLRLRLDAVTRHREAAAASRAADSRRVERELDALAQIEPLAGDETSWLNQARANTALLDAAEKQIDALASPKQLPAALEALRQTPPAENAALRERLSSLWLEIARRQAAQPPVDTTARLLQALASEDLGAGARAEAARLLSIATQYTALEALVNALVTRINADDARDRAEDDPALADALAKITDEARRANWLEMQQLIAVQLERALAAADLWLRRRFERVTGLIKDGQFGQARAAATLPPWLTDLLATESESAAIGHATSVRTGASRLRWGTDALDRCEAAASHLRSALAAPAAPSPVELDEGLARFADALGNLEASGFKAPSAAPLRDWLMKLIAVQRLSAFTGEMSPEAYQAATAQIQELDDQRNEVDLVGLGAPLREWFARELGELRRRLQARTQNRLQSLQGNLDRVGATWWEAQWWRSVLPADGAGEALRAATQRADDTLSASVRDALAQLARADIDTLPAMLDMFTRLESLATQFAEPPAHPPALRDLRLEPGPAQRLQKPLQNLAAAITDIQKQIAASTPGNAPLVHQPHAKEPQAPAPPERPASRLPAWLPSPFARQQSERPQAPRRPDTPDSAIIGAVKARCEQTIEALQKLFASADALWALVNDVTQKPLSTNGPLHTLRTELAALLEGARALLLAVKDVSDANGDGAALIASVRAYNAAGKAFEAIPASPHPWLRAQFELLQTQRDQLRQLQNHKIGEMSLEYLNRFDSWHKLNDIRLSRQETLEAFVHRKVFGADYADQARREIGFDEHLTRLEPLLNRQLLPSLREFSHGFVLRAPGSTARILKNGFDILFTVMEEQV